MGFWPFIFFLSSFGFLVLNEFSLHWQAERLVERNDVKLSEKEKRYFVINAGIILTQLGVARFLRFLYSIHIISLFCVTVFAYFKESYLLGIALSTLIYFSLGVISFGGRNQQRNRSMADSSYLASEIGKYKKMKKKIRKDTMLENIEREQKNLEVEDNYSSIIRKFSV